MRRSTAEPDVSQLRRVLADQLQAAGDLRSQEWRDAIEHVPREAFLGERVYRRIDTPEGTLWEPVTPATLGQARWLKLAYENSTWVTQLDGHDHLEKGAVQGAPTSSSTLPGLVVRMLEDLDVQDGHTVLEIGTGSGYSTGLLCKRLGDARVTSVEIDPSVAQRAQISLLAAGYHPTLVTGDGLSGHGPCAPYDRIIATCSVRTVPAEWLAQARPGARILVTLSSWLYGSGLVAMDVSGDSAHGRFLQGTVSFMPARAHAAPPLSSHFPGREGDARITNCGADILDDWMGLFLAGLAAPSAQRAHLVGADGEPAADFIVDQAARSYAWLTCADGIWTVRQHGPERLWDQIEHAYDRWQQAGKPAQHEFTMHVTANSQTIRLCTPNGEQIWTLPAGPPKWS